MILFALLLILPILNCFILSISENKRVINLSSSLAVVVYIALIFALKSGISERDLTVFSLSQELALAFKFNKQTANYLLLLSFIWLIFEFYIRKFFELSTPLQTLRDRLLFSVNIAFISMTILASNIFSLTIFTTILSLFYYVIFDKFLCKERNIYTQFYKFIILVEPFLLLVASLITYYFSKQSIFLQDGILQGLNLSQTIFIFIFYFIAVFLSILSISYIFYNRFYDFETIANFIILVLFFGFTKLFIFIRISSEIFGFGLFSSIISRFGMESFELIFLINILISYFYLLFSKDFRAIFFYLFFSQLIFAFFTIFIFILHDEGRVYEVLTNFVLVITLMFLTFSNLILYLKNAQNKDFTGIFYTMKVTISLMIFGFLCLMGLMPSISGIEKFALLKIAIKNNLPFTLLMIFLNIFALTIFALKIFYSAFFKPEKALSKNDKELSLKIDSASSLMLTSLVLAIIIVLLPIVR